MTSPRTTNARRILAGALLVAGSLGMAGAGSAGAKEVGSGGTVTPAAPACDPVTSLSYKGDATTSDTGLATIDVTYSVKPCTSAPVTVTATMFESATPSVVVYDDPAAPQNGKFRVAGVKANFSYQVKISVFDATSGTLSGSKTIFAAAIRKRV